MKAINWILWAISGINSVIGLWLISGPLADSSTTLEWLGVLTGTLYGLAYFTVGTARIITTGEPA